MELPESVSRLLLNAEGKALATMMEDFPHVVPVSTVKIVSGKILLVNYFMGQTARNIKANPKVSLACWMGAKGYQIKCSTEYLTSGDIFDEIVKEAKEKFPKRSVNGVLLLTPNEIFDVSVTAEKPGARI